MRDHTTCIWVEKIKALVSCTVTAQLNMPLILACTKNGVSHFAAHIIEASPGRLWRMSMPITYLYLLYERLSGRTNDLGFQRRLTSDLASA